MVVAVVVIILILLVVAGVLVWRRQHPKATQTQDFESSYVGNIDPTNGKDEVNDSGVVIRALSTRINRARTGSLHQPKVKDLRGGESSSDDLFRRSRVNTMYAEDGEQDDLNAEYEYDEDLPDGAGQEYLAVDAEYDDPGDADIEYTA